MNGTIEIADSGKFKVCYVTRVELQELNGVLPQAKYFTKCGTGQKYGFVDLYCGFKTLKQVKVELKSKFPKAKIVIV